MITTSRDGRRGGGASRRFSRQIKQSGLNKLISGLKNGNGVDHFACLDKSSKERIKKLSAVNTHSSTNEEQSYEMGCDSTDIQEALPSISGSGANNRFKLPRKLFFDDCSAVNQVSVPRKIRSAMKKRNRESISPPFPDSKKLDHPTGGVDSPKRVGIKKSKLNLKQGGPNWSFKQNVGGPITKDEEEVVETLYALAGMFPDSEPHCKNKLDSVSLDASPSPSREASESRPIKFEGIKEDLNVSCLSRSEDVNPASDWQRSTEITVKVYSLNGPNIQESSDCPISEKLDGELDCSAAGVNFHKVFVKHEEQEPQCNAVNFCSPHGLHQDTGKIKQPVMVEGFLLERKPEIAGQTTIERNQLNQQHNMNESNNNGPALWPGLSSTVSTTACHGPLLQSCAAKIPVWLGTRPGSFQNGSSAGKASKLSTNRRSWKRCATHVYVSRLIQALQMPESKGSLTMPSNQRRPHDMLKQGVLMNINDLDGIRNDSNGVASDAKSSNDTKNGILQHLRPHQDHSEADLSSGAYTPHKQSFNFLSLSAGGGGKEPNISSNGAGNGLEPLSQLRVPYHAQHPVLMPFFMSQTQYISAYPDQSSSAAVQQDQFQSPSSLSSPYSIPYASPKALTKQQQQQQRLWAAQLAAQCRNCGTSTAMSPFPSLQNGRQDSPALMTCIPTSPSSLEVLGPKYPQISQQQQQQFMAIAMPQARMKRQNHHVSSVYEETGVGFQAGGTLSLQLLCNERL